MTKSLFNIGDRIVFRDKGGWRWGRIVQQELVEREKRDESGAVVGFVDTMALRAHDEQTGRVVSRDIRNCCAMIRGHHIRKKGEIANEHIVPSL